jgi:N-acetylglucosaminyldiphosphoundecaprenol N-acetyl-beta-D-mannosaminyltransferase
MQLCGVKIDNVSMEEALNKIRDFLNDSRQHYIVTPNPDFLILAQKDKEFKEILNKADLSLPDGIGLVWAARLMGESLKERVAGVDLIENCKLKIEDLRIFLLGGYQGAAEKVAKNWPAAVGFSEEADSIELLARINQCQPNILFAALGAPRQEKWIAKNLSKIPSVKVAIGVGSALNLLSGQIKRAPRIFQALGLEWLWRLFREPRRWRKILRSLIMFPFLVFKSKIKASGEVPEA